MITTRLLPTLLKWKDDGYVLCSIDVGDAFLMVPQEELTQVTCVDASGATTWVCPWPGSSRPTKRVTNVARCLQQFLAWWVENYSMWCIPLPTSSGWLRMCFAATCWRCALLGQRDLPERHLDTSFACQVEYIAGCSLQRWWTYVFETSMSWSAQTNWPSRAAQKT